VHLDGRRAPVLSAHERGADPQSALDLALDKIDRQVVKHKEKVTHRKQATSPVRMPPPDEEPRASAEPERVRLKLKPMSLSDAVSELLADSHAFFVYLDEDSGAILIVAKRADGSVTVIEPVVP
jgi:putative sigma-54 modulation protein